MPPYSNDTMRSVYHVREFEVFKLKQVLLLLLLLAYGDFFFFLLFLFFSLNSLMKLASWACAPS